MAPTRQTGGRTTAKGTKARGTTKKTGVKSKAQLTAEKRLKDKANELGIDEAIQAAAGMEVSTAETWQGRRQAVKLLLPSGNVVKAINKGLMAFVEAGKIPNILMPIVMEGIREGKGLPPEKVATMIDEDPKVLAQMFEMQTIMVAECVTQPRFHEPPYLRDDDGELVLDDNNLPTVDEEAKDPSRLYLDDMDFNDRNFIFNWVMGGTKDLERFRQESAAYVADLQAGGAVGEEAD